MFGCCCVLPAAAAERHPRGQQWERPGAVVATRNAAHPPVLPSTAMAEERFAGCTQVAPTRELAVTVRRVPGSSHCRGARHGRAAPSARPSVLQELSADEFPEHVGHPPGGRQRLLGGQQRLPGRVVCELGLGARPLGLRAPALSVDERLLQPRGPTAHDEPVPDGVRHNRDGSARRRPGRAGRGRFAMPPTDRRHGGVPLDAWAVLRGGGDGVTSRARCCEANGCLSWPRSARSGDAPSMDT